MNICRRYLHYSNDKTNDLLIIIYAIQIYCMCLYCVIKIYWIITRCNIHRKFHKIYEKCPLNIMYFRSNLNMWNNVKRTSKFNCNNEIALTEYSSNIAQYKSRKVRRNNFHRRKWVQSNILSINTNRISTRGGNAWQQGQNRFMNAFSYEWTLVNTQNVLYSNTTTWGYN